MNNGTVQIKRWIRLFLEIQQLGKVDDIYYIFFCIRAEEDEKVARQLMEQEQLQTQAKKMAIELTDEVNPGCRKFLSGLEEKN